ncbi:MAG: hypothetical protein R2749_12680 [Acidimicrobiales bacterium]
MALAAASGVYLLCMAVVPRAAEQTIPWLDVWFHNLLLVAAGLIVLAGAGARADRLGWRFAGAAVLCNATANFSWVLLFDSSPLSPADGVPGVLPGHVRGRCCWPAAGRPPAAWASGSTAASPGSGWPPWWRRSCSRRCWRAPAGRRWRWRSTCPTRWPTCS